MLPLILAAVGAGYLIGDANKNKPIKMESGGNITPGEWYAKQGTHDWFVNSEHGSGNDIAIVREYSGEGEANARLIAAAPELRNALQQLLDICESLPKTFGKEHKEILYNANAAIIKSNQG